MNTTPIIEIAKWFADAFRSRFGCVIDEMKLHKLVYLAQRESLIRSSLPLFSGNFVAWKYGPVSLDIRTNYQALVSDSCVQSTFAINTNQLNVLGYVLTTYGGKSSWSLSRLTHGEQAWLNARGNLNEWDAGYNDISLDDMKADAQRARNRRAALSMLGGRS